MASGHVNQQASKDEWLFCPQKVLCKAAIELLAVLMVAPPSWKNPHSFPSLLNFFKNGVRICPIYIYLWIVCVEVQSSYSFCTDSMPYSNLMSCNGMLCCNLGLSADQYLFKVFVWMRSSLFWDVSQCSLVVTDIWGQPYGPVCKGQGVQEFIWL
jgi:hypothetical protein